jgi:hypothetical protein
MTEFIFLCAFLFLAGVFCGKFFRKLNPFLMLLGFVFVCVFSPLFLGKDKSLYTISFSFGFLYNWYNPFRFIFSLFENLQVNFQLFFAKRRYKNDRKNDFVNAEERVKNKEDKLRYQAEQLKREKQKLNEEWERIKKEWEDIRKKREDQDWKSEQKSSSNKKEQFGVKGRFFKEMAQFDLDDFSRNKAYEVLGVTRETSKKEILAKYKNLQKKYHPDRFHQCSKEQFEEAENISKLINWAKNEVL